MGDSGGGGKTIIVVKKKAGHGHGHHGGSWKVAYADFVTALMAFFMVMWIMGMDSGVRNIIEGYFSNPVGFRKAYGSGSNIMAVGNTPVDSEIKRIVMLTREIQRQQFEEVRSEIELRLQELGGADDLSAQVEILITDQGLRVELSETEGGEPFFALGSARLLPAAETVLRLISGQLERLENDIMIEGHTDAKGYGTGEYSNWELSVDRANAARRIMIAGGLAERRILEVRGFADRNLRVAGDPLDPANRRVTVLLPFKEPAPALIEAIRNRTPLRGTD